MSSSYARAARARGARCIRKVAAVGWLLIIATGCRVRVEGADARAATVPVDTVRLRCDSGPLLVEDGNQSLTPTVERLLAAGDELLLVTRDGALRRYESGNPEPETLLEGGKDYDARGGVVARLERERVSFFRMTSDGFSSGRGAIAAATHEMSVALGSRSVFLHSPVSPANVLVTERGWGEEGPSTAYLPVRRNLLQLILTDADAVLEDTGFVRALDGGFAFVPLIHDPIEIVGRSQVTVFAGEEDRGVIRTVSQRVERDEQACPTCDRHRDVATRQIVRRLYADATAHGGALWVLRLTPPGAPRGLLIRIPLTDASDARAWEFDGVGTGPRALAIWRDRVVVADEEGLRFYFLPAPESGSVCRRGP